MPTSATMLGLAIYLLSLISLITAHPTHPRTHTNKPIRRSKVLNSRAFTADDLYANWPTYDQLPLDPSHPTKSAWGVWGADDINGALNHITNKTIRAAAKEIKIGKAISLNLDLGYFPQPVNPARKPTVHEFHSEPGYTDDILTINTQAGTQYDGLRHFPYSVDGNQSTYQYYNDLLDYEDIVGGFKSPVLGIQQASQKGIAGRGILLDFAAWATAKNIQFDPFTKYNITTTQLDAVAKYQNLPKSWSKPGDILLIRTGWTKKYNTLSIPQRAVLPWLGYTPPIPPPTGPPGVIGLEASSETLAWLWEKKLALVGADNPAFESVPFAAVIEGKKSSLHEVFLAGWGMSIVEHLDLETLADALRGVGRSSFWLSVQCLCVEGGVASPPNAMAVL